MKRFKLLVVLGLLAIPSAFLASQSFKNEIKTPSVVNKINASSNSIKNAPKAEHPFKVGENYYDTLSAAISACPSKGTINMLADYSETHERTSNVDLPCVTINKNLTLNGFDGSGIQHTIKGVRFEISGSVEVNFTSVTIDGDKAYNAKVEGGDVGEVLIRVTNSTLNLNGGTIIKDYKYYSRRVISIAGSTLNIKDNAQITDCAAKYGIIRYDNTAGTSPSTINMSGGKIYNCQTSNMADDPYHEGVLLYMSHGLDASSSQAAKFNMTGGEISGNTGTCWSDQTYSESPGLIFIRSKKAEINITGGCIKNNEVALGGAIYSSDDPSISGNINIGGDAIIYGNKGRESGKVVDSNIYCNTDPDTFKINVDKNKPLTKDAKVGVFLKSSLLPSEGNSRKVVNNATSTDCAHFIADNSDYTMKYNSANKTIDIYKYRETDPRFTEPTIVAKDTLTYNGSAQGLISQAGTVSKGGAMKYSTDYNGDISEAHWVTDAKEIKGTDAKDYKVTYYVPAGGGAVASTPVTIATNIKPQSVTSDPFSLDESEFVYNGAAQVPKITNDKGYIEDTDYKVNLPTDVTNVGSKSITITMIGNYSGSFTKTYSITPCVINEIIWPEDEFTYNGEVQEISPTFTNVYGKSQKLTTTTCIVDGEGKFIRDQEFKEASNKGEIYCATASCSDTNYVLASTVVATNQYTMRLSSEDIIEDIEVIPGTNKPIVKIETDIDLEAWKKLKATSIDKNEEKEEYKEATDDLASSKNLVGDDAVSAIYDVKIIDQDNIEYQPDGTLKIYFALPENISANNNISIYHIHVNDDGSKEIKELPHEFASDGYASIITDKLSSFVIVHHQVSLMWLIITLSVVNGGLVTAIVLPIVLNKHKKSAKAKKGKK